MSKARAKAIAAIAAALDADADKAPTAAICALIEDGLGSLERMAVALEERNVLLKPLVAQHQSEDVIRAVAEDVCGRILQGFLKPPQPQGGG